MRCQFFRFCVPTPLGRLWLVLDGEEGIHQAFWDGQQDEAERHWRRWYGSSPRPRETRGANGVAAKLVAYFAGHVRALDTLTVRARGTPFQQKIWRLLRSVPAGSPVSYATIARNAGLPGASRAVGQAVGANPVTLIVPCHRLVASSGALGGYAGGVHRKRWLLDHEANFSR
ncbi:MAG: methylated-DNA--protein-cysteine methyltransferase [Candidatus Binatia bacterium]|nr:MAG: methylated-DNA--protein-cysteine methyltransferase [Candidatus Binatia bacterium]